MRILYIEGLVYSHIVLWVPRGACGLWVPGVPMVCGCRDVLMSSRTPMNDVICRGVAVMYFP